MSETPHTHTHETEHTANRKRRKTDIWLAEPMHNIHFTTYYKQMLNN